ncbi:MAG: hypothetical protein M2R45_01090 [Verrucomicrobia subdivision 3 bacterium]|nr:hypothetical protein [Limisphaerales bacterium]MCS1414201.1 hypothetical protein [Limisphaerales bacterium]
MKKNILKQNGIRFTAGLKTITCGLLAAALLAGLFFTAGPSRAQSWLQAVAGALALQFKEQTIGNIFSRIFNETVDAFLRRNNIPDPRQHKTSAYPLGIFWTSASYQRNRMNYPGVFDDYAPSSESLSVSQGHEVDDPVKRQYSHSSRGSSSGISDYLSELKAANFSGWIKQYEITWEGEPFYPYQFYWYGSSSDPFDAKEAIAYVREWYDDDELELGTLLYHRTDEWEVGDFILESDYKQSSAVVHPMLRQPATYTVLYKYSKAKAAHGIRSVGTVRGTIEHYERYVQLDCHQPDSITLDLVDDNEVIVKRPWVSGGVDRWVETITQRDCNHKRRGPWGIFPPRHDMVPAPGYDYIFGPGELIQVPRQQLAPQCREYTTLVVKETKSYPDRE